MSQNYLSQKELIIASSNKGKVKEFKKLLESFPLRISSQPEGIYLEETGKTFQENARLKALTLAQITGKLSLADDSGLCVDALNGAPGIYSARFGNTDEERISRLLYQMKLIKKRNANFHSALCIASPKKEILLEVEGISEGVITTKKRGVKGFGYDPIFEVISIGLTYAEMSVEQKFTFGHRGKAFKQLEPLIKKIL